MQEKSTDLKSHITNIGDIIYDTITEVREYIKRLLAQFAAKAYLDGLAGELKKMVIDTKNDYADPATLTGRLALGPNDSQYFAIDSEGSREDKGNDRWSSTLMTKGMLDEFAQKLDCN